MSFYDKDTHKGEIIGDAVKKVFNENGLKCDIWVTDCGAGCRRI
jgi:homoserine kinase